MSLEDFFTLSEMKDGITNVVRIEELILIMENEKESLKVLEGDAARQWSTVGNIIAVTERGECLERFIGLNGLLYLAHWLEEAHKKKSEGEDSSTEDLVNATLSALNRLPVDWEAPSNYGIRLTLTKLRGSLWSEKVLNKVNALTEKWVPLEDRDGAVCEDGQKSPRPLQGSEDLTAEEEKVNADKSTEVVEEDIVNAEKSTELEKVNVRSSFVGDPRSSEIASVSLCLSPNVGERDNDADDDGNDDDDESGGSHREGDVSTGKVDDMDTDVEPKEESSSGSSPKNAPFMTQDMISDVGEPKRERSEIGMEYGEIDALEVARQVAIEVEREVVDYREPFCSSSPEIAGNMENPDDDPDNKADDDGDDDDGDNDGDDEDVDDDDDDDDDGNGSSSETCGDESLENPYVATRKLNIDLNEGICSEEEDDYPTAASAGGLSAPVAVAASKGPPAAPPAPLFKGELGWRGSVATSAFRPTAVTAQWAKSPIFPIDLNVTDGSDGEQSPPSSAEVNPSEFGFRTNNLGLDLNRREEDDVVPLGFWGPLRANGINPCSSPAAASLRDFDLNDDPSSFEATGRLMGRSFKLDDLAVGPGRWDAPPPQVFGYCLPPPYYGAGATPVVPPMGGQGGPVRPGQFAGNVVGPAALGLNMAVGGVGRMGLDLNAGGGGARGDSSGSLRHLQLGGGSGGGGLKRKEPEWDPPYSIGCKQGSSWQ